MLRFRAVRVDNGEDTIVDSDASLDNQDDEHQANNAAIKAARILGGYGEHNRVVGVTTIDERYNSWQATVSNGGRGEKHCETFAFRMFNVGGRSVRLAAIIRENPGLSAAQLRTKGWNPPVHGTLLQAEQAGLIVYRNEGWHPTSQE